MTEKMIPDSYKLLLPLFVFDPRVDDTVEKVNDQVNTYKHSGYKKYCALYRGIIPLIYGIYQVGTDSVYGKYLLCDYGSREKSSEACAHLSYYGDEGILQCVNEDYRLLPQALGSRCPYIIRLKHVKHAASSYSGKARRRLHSERHCGKEVLDELDAKEIKYEILFLDARAALAMASKVAIILAQERGKDQAWADEQIEQFKRVAANYIL